MSCLRYEARVNSLPLQWRGHERLLSFVNINIDLGIRRGYTENICCIIINAASYNFRLTLIFKFLYSFEFFSLEFNKSFIIFKKNYTISYILQIWTQIRAKFKAPFVDDSFLLQFNFPRISSRILGTRFLPLF